MRSYIKESGEIAAQEIGSLTAKLQGGNMLLMYTDRFLCVPQQEITDIAHLLEIRLFTETAELRIMRSSIDSPFYYRLIDDNVLSADDYLDEYQYLDIDTKHPRTSGMNYVTTGGGVYSLPIENAKKVLIRNYISYDDQGIAQITDFRIVGFLTKEANS